MEDIQRFAFAMSALNDDRFASQFKQVAGCGYHLVFRPDGSASEQFGLWNIRSNDSGQWQQIVLDNIAGVA